MTGLTNKEVAEHLLGLKKRSLSPEGLARLWIRFDVSPHPPKNISETVIGNLDGMDTP